MSSPDESTSFRAAAAVGTVVAALPVPALAPVAGGGLAAALVTGSRRRNAGLGAVVGFGGGLLYIVGWAALVLVISGTFPPQLPDGGPFEGFAAFVLVLDVLGGAAGGALGGALARRARSRGDTDEQTGHEQLE